jgi:hypothetical protein
MLVIIQFEKSYHPMGEVRGAYSILVGRPEGRRPLERPRRRWGITLRWIFGT